MTTTERTSTDLFREVPEHAMTPAQRRELLGRKYPKNGYAAPPGTGPEGETCGSCEHKAVNQMYSKKRFYKCGLIHATWTRSYGTDIKVGSPACRKWERATGWSKE